MSLSSFLEKNKKSTFLRIVNMHKCQWENEFIVENHQKEVDTCFIQMTSKANRNRTKEDLRKSRNRYPVTQVYRCGLMNWDWDHLHVSG